MKASTSYFKGGEQSVVLLKTERREKVQKEVGKEKDEKDKQGKQVMQSRVIC